ncbi:MAG TPA: hypothetical protein PK544_11150 [Spirochaetota bacterium]|nr:hypothetical protein [Spirochaetota bacterium]HPJ38791.1 hypothetical protein [Spirochaetota bacterium]HPQ52609.1 hypothetical protein [Spirochaetota bacterium]
MNVKRVYNNGNDTYSLADYICIALLLGAIWGFFEVFFKDVLSMGGKPYTAAVMTGIGVAFMAAAYGFFRKSGVVMAVAVFSIFARMIVVPVLGCSPMCRANAVVALFLLGSFMALSMEVSSRVVKNNFKTGGLWVGGGVLLSGISFYYGGMACAPCQYLQNFQQSGGLVSFLRVEVMYWVLFSAILYYPGYLAGTHLRNSMNTLRARRPVPYYAGIVCASFLILIATGFMLLP